MLNQIQKMNRWRAVVASNIDWAAYDRSLKQRGNITLWMSDEAIESWYAEPTGKKGAQPTYSDLAIETSLTLRLVFKQGLRQTEGFIESVFDLMNVDLQVPDHSTLSRRGMVLDIPSSISSSSDEGLAIVVDSTGLKIFGAGEWSETKHGLSRRRQWRKLHLSINAQTLEVVESSLTDNKVGDSTEAVNHIKNIETPINEFMGDGAYDCHKIYNEVEARDDGGNGSVTIPPRKNSVVSEHFPENATQRDKHIEFIDTHGRPVWEMEKQYSRRLLVENAMGRFKGIIGATLRTRDIESQKIEVLLACKILNKMIGLGTPLRPAIVQV